MSGPGNHHGGGALRPQRLAQAEWSRWWGLRFRVRERFARSLLIVPVLYIVGALVLADVMPDIEGNRDVLSLGLDADTARTMLSAVAGGMIAFTGLVVSVAILVVQFGASQYTPRLVNLFRRDRAVKHALGIFIAPAIFAMASLRTIGEDGSDVVPSLTLTVNALLLIAAVVAFFLLVADLLDLLRPRRVIGHIVVQGRAAIAETYPARLGDADEEPPPAPPPAAVTVHHRGEPGVLAALDRGRLVRAARAAGAVIEVTLPIGAYVPSGAPLFVIRGAGGVDEEELRRSALLAEERTITQDPAFAARIIVDLALRALSPAVNDPTTAVQAIDGLGSLLASLAERDLHARGALTDEEGNVRLLYPTPTWAEFLDLSLTEIRHYGAGSPQIPRRLRALLDGLLATSPPARHHELAAQARRLDAAVERAFPDPVERAHALEPDILGIGAPHRERP